MIGSLPAIGYYPTGAATPTATAFQSLAAYPAMLVGPPVSVAYGGYASYGVQAYGQLNGYLGSPAPPLPVAPPYSFPYGQPSQPYGWAQPAPQQYSPVTDAHHSTQLWQNPYLTGSPSTYQANWSQYGGQSYGYPPEPPPHPPAPPTPPAPPAYEPPPPAPEPPAPPPPAPDPPAQSYEPCPPEAPPLDSWASFEGGTVNYPALNPLSITTDFQSAAEVVRLRLIGGDAGDLSSLTMNGGDPRNDADGRAAERVAIYNTLEANQRLRYNVDQKAFVTTFPDGATRKIATLEHVLGLPEEVDLKQHLADRLAASDAKFPPWYPGGRVPEGAPATSGPLPSHASFERGSVQFPPLNPITTVTDFESAAQVVELRLIGGTPEQRAVYTAEGRNMRSNLDGHQSERLAVYTALQTSDRLRFNVDTGAFVLTYPDGATRDLDTLDHLLATGRGRGPALAEHVRALIQQTDQQLPPWTFGANHNPNGY